MTVTQTLDTSTTYAGFRVGPGTRLQFTSTLATTAGDFASGSITYTLFSSLWVPITSLNTPTVAGGHVRLDFNQPKPDNPGAADGTAVDIIVNFFHAGGAFIEGATFSGYSWDAVSTLALFLDGLAISTSLVAVLDAVQRSFP